MTTTTFLPYSEMVDRFSLQEADSWKADFLDTQRKDYEMVRKTASKLACQPVKDPLNDFTLKQVDMASAHLLGGHDRLREELLIRPELGGSAIAHCVLSRDVEMHRFVAEFTCPLDTHCGGCIFCWPGPVGDIPNPGMSSECGNPNCKACLLDRWTGLDPDLLSEEDERELFNAGYQSLSSYYGTTIKETNADAYVDWTYLRGCLDASAPAVYPPELRESRLWETQFRQYQCNKTGAHIRPRRKRRVPEPAA